MTDVYVATPKPHILSAKVDHWGEVAFALLCPYTVADRDIRQCLMGLEPGEACEWEWYDSGEHHKDCPAFNNREAQCVDVGAGLACWPAEPDECDGFSTTEIGHAHPTEGCWAVELIGEIGWGEAVRWAKDEIPRDLALPIEVHASCDDEGVTLALWPRELRQEGTGGSDG